MAMKDGQILIKEADNTQFMIIKSWNKMRWNKAEKMLQAPADIELLNRLAELVTLPAAIEEERRRLNAVAAAIDKERFNEDPKPLYKYPVKLPLFKHQTRGANMALMALGLITPKE